ncbi:MAG: PAS domain S-box protein [Enhygromyxa sp.]
MDFDESRDSLSASEMPRVLEAFVQHAPVGLVVFDRKLRMVRINDHLAAIHGICREQTLGRRVSELLPEVGESVEPILREVLASGEAAPEVEISGETPAEPGRRRQWLCTCVPLRIDGSGVAAVGAVVVEVTARREVEEALRESEARYRHLYLHSPAMMHSIDSEGRIVDVNDAWLERMGYAREEVVGRRSVELLTPQSRERAVNEVLPVFFRTGVVKDIAYQFVCKDGEILDILLSAVAQQGPGGSFDRSLAVLVDVTERKRAQEALRRSEEQLRQAQKLEAIGRLAGGVAHDFNNLLVVMLGNAELLLAKLDEPELREYAEEIALAGERAAGLTRQILTFSRRQLVQARIVDLNELIRDTEGLLCRLIGEDIELVLGLEPSLGQVCIDPSQAAQVLMNLVVNASDAMPRGGRLVIGTANASAELGGVGEPAGHVLLTVSDTGVGMDSETQARLFEPFFTTKEPGRGTGLGLATVYGIVSQAGGFITVDSEPGRGSSFRVFLPRRERPAGG